MSDVVIDVVRAADPKRYQQSLDKLRQAQQAAQHKQAAAGPDHSSFPSSFKGAGLAAKASSSKKIAAFANIYQANKEPRAGAEVTNRDFARTAGVKTTPKHQAYEKFEALMLQNFVEHMFTSDASSVYGKGQAGKIWQSMMAEAMAGEMARSGGIGIAKMLEQQEVRRKSADGQE